MRKSAAPPASQSHGRFLQLILGLIFLLFIGILVALYIVAKRTNPVILDETGKPMQSSMSGTRNRKRKRAAYGTASVSEWQLGTSTLNREMQ